MENRSFDSIFGKLNDYRAKFGLGADVNGLPPDCSATNSDWTIPCSAVNKAPDASGFPTTPIYAFHLKTSCIQNTSADWIVSHWAFNSQQPSSNTWVGDGFVIGAASASGGQGDTEGIRAMGFYTAADLEFHYWLATQFATSDTWFSPAPTKTEPNRYYMVGATSGGHAYQLAKDPITGAPDSPIRSKTIFDLLNAAGIDWRMYVQNNSPSGQAFVGFSAASAGHIVNDDSSASHFIADAQSGNLPPVTYIENPDADEHPGAQNIESGVALSKAMVDAVMHGPLWKDSVFIITFDEGGGLYDHVQPLTVPNPDGMTPIDICTSSSDPRCPAAAKTHANPPSGPPDPDGDFTRTGYRVPLMVISPWVKPGYVSHIQTDYTAWLKFVETRFHLPNLTARDAAASDMTDFFDFSTPHLLTPPGNEPAVKNLSCHSTLP